MSSETQKPPFNEGENAFNPHDFLSRFNREQQVALDLYDLFTMHEEERGFDYHARLRHGDLIDSMKSIGVPVVKNPFKRKAFTKFMRTSKKISARDQEHGDAVREFVIGCGYALLLGSTYEIDSASRYGGQPYKFYKRPEVDKKRLDKGVSALKIATDDRVLENEEIMSVLNTLPPEVLEIISSNLAPTESQPATLTQPQ